MVAPCGGRSRTADGLPNRTDDDLIPRDADPFLTRRRWFRVSSVNPNRSPSTCDVRTVTLVTFVIMSTTQSLKQVHMALRAAMGAV